MPTEALRVIAVAWVKIITPVADLRSFVLINHQSKLNPFLFPLQNTSATLKSRRTITKFILKIEAWTADSVVATHFTEASNKYVTITSVQTL
jgi:hypothetical protein